jgi:hypothetical protein
MRIKKKATILLQRNHVGSFDYVVQLCYDYNTITYNLIRIHIHQLFIFSSYVFHFEWFKML